MAYVVTQSYRIRPQFRDDYLKAVPAIVKAGTALGCVWFEVYERDDEPNAFTEMMAFDSWTHYERLRAIPPTTAMETVFRDLDRWIEGGLSAVRIRALKSITA
jgi:quinol monooxygenase YgiN